MKTIGAKVDQDFFDKCELVREQEELSRSDYVRNALEAYNILHYFKRLTAVGLPVLFGGEPDDDGRTEPSSTLDTSILNQISGGGVEQVPLHDLRGSSQ